MKKLIFISHRHADAPIAKCIRDTLLEWKVPDKNIFVSSAPEAGGQAGQPIEEEIIDKIKQAGLLIIVLTDPAEDLSYVTMEYGIARGIENSKPNVIVFECGQPHKLFTNIINIKVNHKDNSDIRKFTQQFHKNDDYIIGENAFGKDVNDNAIVRLAEYFHSELIKVIPESKASVLHRWPLMVLTLPADKVKELITLDEYKDELAAKDIIYESGTVVIRRGPVESIFGLGVEEDDGSPWSNYVSQWKSSFNVDPLPSPEWIDAIHLEVFKAIRKRPPTRLEYTILNPVNNKEYTMSFPRMKRYADGSMDFDVYFYPIQDAPDG